MPKPLPDLIAETKSECRCMDARAAREFYDVTTGATIIDVRETSEAEQAKLQQSINIPRGLLEMKITELCPSDNLPILIHCATGGRASLAARSLQNMGYNNVHVIDADFDDIQKIFSKPQNE